MTLMALALRWLLISFFRYWTGTQSPLKLRVLLHVLLLLIFTLLLIYILVIGMITLLVLFIMMPSFVVFIKYYYLSLATTVAWIPPLSFILLLLKLLKISLSLLDLFNKTSFPLTLFPSFTGDYETQQRKRRVAIGVDSACCNVKTFIGKPLQLLLYPVKIQRELYVISLFPKYSTPNFDDIATTMCIALSTIAFIAPVAFE